MSNLQALFQSKFSQTLALFIFTTTIQVSIAIACPPIDPDNKDADGMPFCPSLVVTSSAYAVFGCAISQAKTFHAPTSNEKSKMHALLSAFKNSTINGISNSTTQQILTNADGLGLQACRVKQNSTLNGVPGTDSYLLVYTKPGVTNYSGPFLMLRETTASKVIIIGPHDDSDGTYADTKVGLAQSHALAVISNGHNRRAVGGQATESPTAGGGDFVHQKDNLGTNTVLQMGTLFPKSVWLHIHGMAISTKVLYRSRNQAMDAPFETALIENSRIQKGDFNNFNADFTVDPLLNSDFYLKTEIPAVIHRTNKTIIADIVREMEKRHFAW